MSEKDFNELFSKNLRHFLYINNKTQADLAKFTGVSTAAVNNWCKGLKLPRMDKVDMICQYLHLKRSDLMEELTKTSSNNYYLSEEAQFMAKFMYENPEYITLLESVQKIKKDDIDIVKQIIDKFVTD